MLPRQVKRVIEIPRIFVVVRGPDAAFDFDALAIVEPLRRLIVVQILGDASPRARIKLQRELLARFRENAWFHDTSFKEQHLFGSRVDGRRGTRPVPRFRERAKE
jgi:hypothetical protein